VCAHRRQPLLPRRAGQFKQPGMHLRTIYRDGFVCTVYEPSTTEHGWDLARLYRAMGVDLPLPDIRYDGSEGELYDLRDDPLQWRNLWDDPGYAKRKSDLVATSSIISRCRACRGYRSRRRREPTEAGRAVNLARACRHRATLGPLRDGSGVGCRRVLRDPRDRTHALRRRSRLSLPSRGCVLVCPQGAGHPYVT